MKRVNLKQQLATGVPQLGLLVMYPSPGVVERIGPDWDWIWIDGQHGEIGYEQTLNLVRACDLIDRPALVRVPDHSYGAIGKVLDMGADGVIVPCVDTVEQARSIVAAAKLPPLGNRSFGGRRVIDRKGREYADAANEEILCVVQVESPQAIANAAHLAAIPGVDALFLGPDDLLLRRGYGVNEPRNEAVLGEDMRRVVEACWQHGKYAVMVGIDPAMFELCARLGFHLIVAGGDVSLLAAGSRKASLEAKSIITNRDVGGKLNVP